MIFGSLQNLIILLISVAALVSSVWALIEALRLPTEGYPAAGKQSKVLWGAILGAAAAIAFVSVPPPVGRGSGALGFLGIATFVAVIYFFVEVKPKVSQHRRPGPRRADRGGW